MYDDSLLRFSIVPSTYRSVEWVGSIKIDDLKY